MPQMEEILLWGGVAVGGYLLYHWWTSQSAAAVTSTVPVVTQAPISVITPAGGEPSAAQLQTQLNRLTATASDWSSAYSALTGKPIDTLYGFNWSSVYGALGNTTITAAAFLSMAKQTGLTPHISLAGLGQGMYRGPVYRMPVARQGRWR